MENSTHPSPEALEAAVRGLGAILDAMGDTTTGPAAVAFRAAIRRRGTEIAQAGGREAMAHVLAELLRLAPDRAETRKAVVTAAWSAVPGW